MLGRIFTSSKDAPALAASKLYNEQTFYRTFVNDLKACRQEVVIESPFITTRRTNVLLPVLQKLHRHGVRITINTRDPEEHDDYLRFEAEMAIAELQDIGVQVLYTDSHHRKLAILDRRILYEGSLNILSQNDSCEVMRRMDSEDMAKDMIQFIKIHKFLTKS